MIVRGFEVIGGEAGEERSGGTYIPGRDESSGDPRGDDEELE